MHTTNMLKRKHTQDMQSTQDLQRRRHTCSHPKRRGTIQRITLTEKNIMTTAMNTVNSITNPTKNIPMIPKPLSTTSMKLNHTHRMQLKNQAEKPRKIILNTTIQQGNQCLNAIQNGNQSVRWITKKINMQNVS